MKLLFCPFCRDVVALRESPRECGCSRVSGHYLDEASVRVSRDAIVLCLDNFELASVVDAMDQGRPVTGNLRAWVLPGDHVRIERDEIADAHAALLTDVRRATAGAECRTCGHFAQYHVAGRCRKHRCGCGGWT